MSYRWEERKRGYTTHEDREQKLVLHTGLDEWFVSLSMHGDTLCQFWTSRQVYTVQCTEWNLSRLDQIMLKQELLAKGAVSAWNKYMDKPAGSARPSLLL